MIPRYDIIQGSEEWHKLKWAKIGGTRAKGLFVKSDTLLLEVLSEYTEQYEAEDTYVSKSMERGNELEPEAVYELMQYTGIKVKSVGWLHSSDYPIIGISPDGISECETIQFEAKCLERKHHLEVCLSNEVCPKFIHQCVHAFTVNPKLETLYFASYRPEALKKLKVIELKRDSMVNLGTPSRPIYKSIDDWTKVALKEADRINKRINELIETLTF